MKLVLHPRQQRPFLPLSVFTLFLMGFYLTRSNRGISLSFPLSFMVACFNTWLALFICHLSEGRLGGGTFKASSVWLLMMLTTPVEGPVLILDAVKCQFSNPALYPVWQG